MWFTSFLNDKILDWSKFKAFADDKTKGTETLEIAQGRTENNIFSILFPDCFPRAYMYRVIKSRDYVIKTT